MWMHVLMTLLICGLTSATSLWNRKADSLVNHHHPEFAIGDIILVNIREQARATNNSKTEVKDENTYNSDILGRLAGFLNAASGSSLGGPGRILTTAGNQLSSSQTTSDYTGEGKLTQNSSLDSMISVMVKDILPNGNLLVEGRKTVQVNREQQEFLLTGVLRPEDVMANQVESGKLANAQIELIGNGSFNRTHRPGFLQRVFGGLF